MSRYGSRLYNYSVLKNEKTAFLVNYGRRRIAFLTPNPFKWCAFFRTIDGMLRYVAVRYGALEISDKYGLPTVLFLKD